MEQKRANFAYAYSKENKIDFQIVDTLKFYKNEYENAKIRGDALSPREYDLYEKLSDAHAKNIIEHVEETIIRVENS